MTGQSRWWSSKVTSEYESGRSTEPTTHVSRDIWDKLDVLSRIVSAIAIPSVIAIGGWFLQHSTSEESIRKDYVALAISILEKPKTKDDSGLREWGATLLNQNAPIPLPSAAVMQLGSGSLVLPVTSPIALFETEHDAQAHCPSDVVVWLNTNSGIYHEKGSSWYGHTKGGAFVCRTEAYAAGDRQSRLAK